MITMLRSYIALKFMIFMMIIKIALVCDDRGNADVIDGTEEEFCEYDALTRGQRMVRVIAGCSNSSNCSLLFSAPLSRPTSNQVTL